MAMSGINKQVYWDRLHELCHSGAYDETLVAKSLYAQLLTPDGVECCRTPSWQYAVFPFHNDPDFTILEVPLDILRVVVRLEAKVWEHALPTQELFTNTRMLSVGTAAVRAGLLAIVPSLPTNGQQQQQQQQQRGLAELRYLRQAGVDITTAPCMAIIGSSQGKNHLYHYTLYLLMPSSAPLNMEGIERCVKELGLDFSKTCNSSSSPLSVCHVSTFFQLIHRFCEKRALCTAEDALRYLELALGGKPHRHKLAIHDNDHYNPLKQLLFDRTIFQERFVPLMARRLVECGCDPFAHNGTGEKSPMLQVLTHISIKEVAYEKRGNELIARHWDNGHAVLDMFLSTPGWHTFAQPTDSLISEQRYCGRSTPCTPRQMSLAEMAVRVRLHNGIDPRGGVQLRKILMARTVEELNAEWPAECDVHDCTNTSAREVPFNRRINGNESLFQVLLHFRLPDLFAQLDEPYYRANLLTAKTLLECGFELTPRLYANWRTVYGAVPMGSEIRRRMSPFELLLVEWRCGRLQVRRSWQRTLKWMWVARLKEDDRNPFRWLPDELMRMLFWCVKTSGTLESTEWEWARAAVRHDRKNLHFIFE